MPAELLPPVHLTDVDLADARHTKEKVDALLYTIQSHEQSLAANWAKLGSTLYQIRDRKFWRAWGFLSFGSYIMELGETVRQGRSQLYHIIGVAETLLPLMTEQQLIAIGISKAGELKRFVKQTGLCLPKALYELAADSSVTQSQLRAAVFQEMRQEEQPKGRWHDFGGAFLLEDEQLEIERALEIAKRLEPVVPHDTPEHLQHKEAMLRIAREFIGTYEQEVERLS
jgi:hypothetical protein